MKKPCLLGILLICSLATAIPVRAAVEVPAPLVTEATLESEETSNYDSTVEETASSGIVSETAADAGTQESASEVQVQEDGTELTADSAAAPALVDDPGQKDDTAPVGDVEQKNDDYSQVYFDELADELANGVDAAKSKYLNQKIVIVGNFDEMNLDENARIEGVSDDSIVISSDEDDITLLVVGRMQTDEQRERFKQFSENDLVVVKGAIPDIDE